jgi:peroxiredoxin
MKLFGFAAAVALILITSIGFMGNPSNDNSKESVSILKKAPDFTLEDTDGNMVKLSDYAGKIVILDFWATWCPPCRAGIPDFVELQKEYGDDVQILGISLDLETKGDVIPFMKEYEINYPVLWGTMDVVADYGNIQSIPTTFIVDQEGNIVKEYVGLKPKSTFEKAIKELL